MALLRKSAADAVNANMSQWQCSQCTLLNDALVNDCGVCGWKLLTAENTSSQGPNSSLGRGSKSNDTPTHLTCSRCSFDNDINARLCDVCEFNFASGNGSMPFKSSDIVVSRSSKGPHGSNHNVGRMTCSVCSFDNFLEAISCIMCGDQSTFSDSKTSSESMERVTRCRYCHVNFPISVGAALESGSRSRYVGCPNCDDGKSSHLSSSAGRYGSERLDQQFQTMSEGIIELLAEVLEKDNEIMRMTHPDRKMTTEFAVCSPCPHISQRGTKGYDWSCGYRNIQMICHAMLYQSSPNCEDNEKRLFNGKGIYN